jgi:hypothetical protein
VGVVSSAVRPFLLAGADDKERALRALNTTPPQPSPSKGRESGRLRRPNEGEVEAYSLTIFE